MKIVTNHVYPPIPIRQFDWSAVTDNYEPGAPIGYGRSEDEAKADLIDQLDDDDRAELARPCDCGAPDSGKWAGIHHPGCQSLRSEKQ